MTFYAVNNAPRPVRLCEETRQFAHESLEHKYGTDTRKTPAVCMDGIEGFDTLSPIGQYDAAILQIAREAPLRICEGERICGAATLGNAIDHLVPAVYRKRNLFYGISHLTVDFETVLKHGISGIRESVLASLSAHRGSDREAFLQSCLHCLDAFELWHGRYLDALSSMPAYSRTYNNLLQVPMHPATDFYTAVQSLWFTFAFLRLCGNWPGIGRIDRLLGGYLQKDLASGRLTLDEAREILAHFFIKGCEWICGGNYGSGDAQHYQNILLAGIDEDGCETTNEVTYLVLDILEELGISDFPTTVRLNRNTDEKLLRRVAEVMRYGGGTLAVYNEELIIEALCRYGYPVREARGFANDGCWEVQIPGKTFFMYDPFDSLRILQYQTLRQYGEDVAFESFDALLAQYKADLRAAVEAVYQNRTRNFADSAHRVWVKNTPCTVVSLFEQGCIEKGLSYIEGGPVYNVVSPHIGGIADTVNSLYAIKKMVFDDRIVSLSDLLAALRANWEHTEPLRQYARNRCTCYGNDSDEVDLLAADLLEAFASYCSALDGRCGYRFPAGVSTFGRQLEWAPLRLAAPHGRKAHEVLAANCSPTPGSDREGATAVIRSYCKIDHSRLVSGSALDLKLLPDSVKGEDGISALVSLMRGFVSLGGFFMQPDVTDAAVLKEAQKCPEAYQTLSVRVSGWNARFVTLNKEWQDMVIGQSEQ